MASSPPRQGGIETGLIDARYEFREVYHRSEHNELRRVKDMLTEESYMLKRDFRKRNCPLDIESEIYQTAQHPGQLKGFAKTYFDGSYGGHRAIIMDLLTQTMEEGRLENGGQLSLIQVCTVGLSVICILERLHDMDFIHRDIQPSNIMTGFPSTADLLDIHLIDFSKAAIYRRRLQGKCVHISKESQEPVPSSLVFGSRRSNLLIPVSRKDDLESLLYTLVYLAKGTLPWIRNDGSPATENVEIMADIKRSTKASALVDGLPSVFEDFRAYIWRLRFKHTPNYQRLKILFVDAVDHELEEANAL